MDRESFTITFDPDLSEEQVRGAIEALADYWRACGGIGLIIEPEAPEAR